MIPPHPGDSTALLSYWNGALVLLIPIIVHGLKRRFAKAPKILWPILAIGFGIGGDWLMAKTGLLPQSSVVLGALCGGSGVALREMSKQVMASLVGSDDEDDKVEAKIKSPRRRRLRRRRRRRRLSNAFPSRFLPTLSYLQSLF